MSSAAEASPTPAVATANVTPATLGREPSQQDLEIARQLQSFQSQRVPGPQDISRPDETVRDVLLSSVDGADGHNMSMPETNGMMQSSAQQIQQIMNQNQFTPMQPPPLQAGQGQDPIYIAPTPPSGGGQQCR